MKTLKQAIFLIIIVALLGLPLFASAQEDVNLTFTMWIPNDHPAMEAIFNPLAEAYMSENPNVTIEYVFIPIGEYDTTMATRLSGSNPPDAGWMLERSGPAYMDAGVLYDMSGVLTGDEAYNYADFSEPASAQWVDESAVYGVPFSTSPFITIYNATLFEEAGLETPDVLYERGEWTWEALREAAKTISDNTEAWGFVGNDGTALYTTNPWATMIPLLRAYGADVLDGNTCTLDSDEATEAMSLLHGMIFTDRSTVPPGDETVFWTGDVGITLGQISRLSNLDEAAFEWGIAPLPTGPAGEQPVIGQAAMVTFNGANNANQEAAADFVRFLTTQEGVTRLAQFFPPTRQSVLASEEFLTTNARVSAEDMENIIAPGIANGRVLTSHPNFPEMELIGNTIFDMLWMPDADVASTLDLYCQTVSTALE